MCAMEAIRWRVPRKRLPIGSLRGFARGIVVLLPGFMSKRKINGEAMLDSVKIVTDKVICSSKDRLHQKLL